MKGTGPKTGAKKAAKGADGETASGEREGEDNEEAKKSTKRKRAPAKAKSPKKAKVAKDQDTEEVSEKAKIDEKGMEDLEARGVRSEESDVIAHSDDGEY